MSEPNLWRASSAEHFAAPALDHDLTVDLAVIGAGFTGCSAALEAARTGVAFVRGSGELKAIFERWNQPYPF